MPAPGRMKSVLSNFRLTAICGLVASLAVWHANAAQSLDDLLRDALARYQRGDMEGAIQNYRTYLEVRPEAFDVRSNLGAALVGLGRFDEAIAEYRRALAADPNNPSVLMNLGLAYYKMGRFTEAVQHWSTAHAVQPLNRQITMLLADAELHLGENARVIALLGPAEQIDPQDLGAAYLLSTSLIAEHQPQDAKALVERILKNGDSAAGRILLGTLALQRGDLAAAAAELERATEMDPKLPNAFSSYGAALLGMGEPARAEAAFRRELAGNPNDFLSHLDLGFLVKQNQQYEDAMAHFRRALELRPGDVGARYQIASVHLLTGDLAAAAGELESIIRDAPQFVAAHVSLTTTYYRLKRKEDGDHERALVQELDAEAQARQSDAQPSFGNLPHP
jgi:tetratricopeptide (TPR) repeat protein